MTLEECTPPYIQIQLSLKTFSSSVYPSIDPSMKLSFPASLLPFIHLTIHSSSHLVICFSLSVFHFISPSIYTFIHLFICRVLLHIHLSINSFLYLYFQPFINSSFYKPIYPCIYLFIHPFILPFVHLSNFSFIYPLRN